MDAVQTDETDTDYFKYKNTPFDPVLNQFGTNL